MFRFCVKLIPQPRKLMFACHRRLLKKMLNNHLTNRSKCYNVGLTCVVQRFARKL
jgi:hypothetical protein